MIDDWIDEDYIPNEELFIINNKIDEELYSDWIKVENRKKLIESYCIKEFKFVIPIQEYTRCNIYFSYYDNSSSLVYNLFNIISVIETERKIYHDNYNYYVVVPSCFFGRKIYSNFSICVYPNDIGIYIKKYNCQKQTIKNSCWFILDYILKGFFQYSGYILGIFIQTTTNDRYCDNRHLEDKQYKVIIRYKNKEKKVYLNKINKFDGFGIYTYFLNLNVLPDKYAMNPKNYKHYYKNKEHLINWKDLSIGFTGHCAINKIEIET